MNSSTDAGSLKRGVVILKLLASAGARGLALTELSARARIPHPSVHRILGQLSAERLASFNDESKRYRLGPLAFELGLASSTMHDIRDLCEPAMNTLAHKTEDTVYLVVRSGFDAVCMHRREGSFPIRTLVLEVGSRRPLGVGAGGLAILSSIEEEERAHIIERVAPSLAAFGKMTAEDLAESCRQANALGAAVIQNRVTLGVKAVGVPFRDSMGQAIGALSVAALAQRLNQQRVRQVVDMLHEATRSVELLLRKRRP